MAVIITLIIGIQAVVVGLMVRYWLKPRVSLSAEVKKVNNGEDPGKWTGDRLIWLGTLSLPFIIFQMVFPAWQYQLFFLYMLILVPAFCLRIYFGLKRSGQGKSGR